MMKDSLTERLRISKGEACSSKGMIVYRHSGKRSDSGAFDSRDTSEALIYIPRSLMARSVKLCLYGDAEGACLEYGALPSGTHQNHDIYQVDLCFNEHDRGLYYAEIIADTVIGIFYGYKQNGSIVFSSEKRDANIQISVSDFKFAPTDIYGGIIYHIFVDRFARGDANESKNGKYLNWKSDIPEYQKYPGEPIGNKYFYGGTLHGIIKKLGYLKSLGVTVLYLSPIFKSPSNHKYDTSDYMRVDEGFGGDRALTRLIEKAKKKGIGIILDGVFNHTGSDSIYFDKEGRYGDLGAYRSKDSIYYSWYNFYKYPDEYECWWGIKILPRINTDKHECRSYFIKEDGVIPKYAKMGIKGFRLDVADELSDAFIKDIKRELAAVNEKNVLYGEVWEDASSKTAYGKRKEYYLGDELDGVMNYPLREGIIEFIREKKTEKLRFALTELMNNAPRRIRDAEMNILGSHDTVRIITALGGGSPDGLSNDELSRLRMNEAQLKRAIKRLKSAYTVISTLPGIPCIYYGDEALTEGYSDPFNRRTYPWGEENKELLDHYKAIGGIRRQNEVYSHGEFRLLHLTIDILLFVRYNSIGSAYYTLMNNSEDDLNVSFSSPAKSLLDGLYFNTLKLAPEESRIFRLDRSSTIDLSLQKGNAI